MVVEKLVRMNLQLRGVQVQVFQRARRFTGTLSDLPDLVLSVGGDGTFLETVLKIQGSWYACGWCQYRQDGISGKYSW